MRAWLKPDRMRAYNLSVDDVMKALDEQSVIGSPGRIGRSDGKQAQSLEYVLSYQGRFNDVEQYKNVILRANANGESLHLKDVANVELGSEYYDIYSNLNQYPSAAIVLKQTYDSNASDVIKEVKAKLEELKKSSFPPGMDYKITYDVSNFLDASIENVIHTLRDAFILVALVVFLFLGDWRSTKGVSIGNAMNTLSIMVGSTYELGFIKYQRFFKVFVQASPEYRRLPEDILNMWAKNDKGEMVPFSAFMKIVKTQGANKTNRYNMYTTASIRGGAAAGFSSGEAIKAVQEVAKELPHGYDIDWGGLSKDEVSRGNESIVIFLIVLVFVYLVLAAQYESFLLPLAVIFSLVAGVFGSFLFIKIFGLANDIYAQVGLVMLVGLLGKNAVLIVEFAALKHEEGMSVRDAAIEGARVRFRPILMTSFAFIAGLIPLVVATGAGAIGNRTIGSSALGGMLFGTVFGVIIIPGLYYFFGTLAGDKKLIRDENESPIFEGVEPRVLIEETEPYA
ncbi:hypothetical protein GCM10011495_33940 [Hymenobacter frigidus]|uniref:Efflux RND transporter permease subunit n=1 Tax=Hymenobacter frigidus TaxID=1524095 RepID=A0ABQ2AG32_9BACT|nr:hypothetical protein GCM10011495_33940 [Hymenobacter frigidus]